MKYVLNADGSIKAGENGHPVVVEDDGKEFTIDAIGAAARIKELNQESAGHRKDASDSKKKLESFSAISDPEAALAALRTVDSLSTDHKVQVESLTKSLNESWTAKLVEKDKFIEGLSGQLFQANVMSKFALSEVIKKTVLPPDIAAATFGKHFNNDGTAKDAAGNTIYSKERPGQPATFDEAMEVIIQSYPGKDSILRGSILPGGGGHNSGGGNDSGVAAVFDKNSKSYSLTEQAKIAKANPELYKKLKNN